MLTISFINHRRLQATLAHAHNSHLWMINNRRKIAAPHGTGIGDRKCPTLKLLERNFAGAGALDQIVQFDGKLFDAFAVNIANHGHNQTVFRIDGNADMKIIFVNNLTGSHIQSCIKLRIHFKRGGNRFDGKHRHRQAAAFSRNISLVFLTEGLQLGDIHLILAGHMGYLRPGNHHLLGCRAADGAERFPIDRAPAGKIGQGRRWNDQISRIIRRCHFSDNRRAGRIRSLFGKSADIISGDHTPGPGGSDLLEINTQFSRQAAGRR